MNKKELMNLKQTKIKEFEALYNEYLEKCDEFTELLKVRKYYIGKHVINQFIERNADCRVEIRLQVYKIAEEIEEIRYKLNSPEDY